MHARDWMRSFARWFFALLLLPASTASGAPPAPARLEPAASPPPALQEAVRARHAHHLREAIARRSSPPSLPGQWTTIARPLLGYTVPTQAASLAFDFGKQKVKVTIDFTLVSQSAGLDHIYLVAAEELSGQMEVFDVQGPLAVASVGQGARAVTLRQPLASGQSAALSMTWQGSPSCSGFCAVSPSLTYNLYTSWLPIFYDLGALGDGGVVYPATSTLAMTLPPPLVANASGELLSNKLNRDGTTTFQFREQRFGRFNIAIAPYTVESTPGSVPLVRSYLRGAVSSAGAAWRQAATEILGFHIQQYGSYDFAKADLVEVPDTMAAAGVAGLSMVFLPSSAFAADGGDWHNRQTLAHELAHQWFAMMIHNVDHSSPWLSEGLATFAEAEYSAAAAAKAGADVAAFGRRFAGLFYQAAVREGGDVPLSSEAVVDAPTLIYVAVTYEKGSLVTGMLKYLVGDAAFRDGIAIYKKQHGDEGTVATLLASLKQASGMDLTGFAKTWIYGTGFPTYHVSVSRQPGRAVEVVLESGSDFGIPIELEVLTADGQVLRPKLTPSGARLSYNAAPGAEILQVRADPDARVLGRFVPALAGDVQLSGEVDGIDLISEAWAVGQKFSAKSMGNPYEAAPFADWADLVVDSAIDQKDLDLVLGSFGKTQS